MPRGRANATTKGGDVGDTPKQYAAGHGFTPGKFQPDALTELTYDQLTARRP